MHTLTLPRASRCLPNGRLPNLYWNAWPKAASDMPGMISHTHRAPQAHSALHPPKMRARASGLPLIQNPVMWHTNGRAAIHHSSQRQRTHTGSPTDLEHDGGKKTWKLHIRWPPLLPSMPPIIHPAPFSRRRPSRNTCNDMPVSREHCTPPQPPTR